MKLICRKCDKEIMDWSVNRLQYDDGNQVENVYRVSCHGEIDKGLFKSMFSDIYFFEKDEPASFTELEKYVKELFLKWQKDRGEPKKWKEDECCQYFINKTFWHGYPPRRIVYTYCSICGKTLPHGKAFQKEQALSRSR